MCTRCDAQSADKQGCDTTGATDYFPVKVSPQHSHHWDVEYRKWYKVATYTLDGKTHRYVLTRKGCPTPDVTDIPHAARFQRTKKTMV